MTSTSRVSVEEAARRLSLSTSEVRGYISTGKLQTVGHGEELRILWPETDPGREIYPQPRQPASSAAVANGHPAKTGSFPEHMIQAETNDATDPKWLVPLVLFLWLSLFLAGGFWLFYLLRFSPQLPVANSLR